MAEELRIPRRWIFPVPVLTPKLSSAWIHLVTPLSARIARPLAEGLRNRVVCRNDEAARTMPRQLLTVREAIREAIRRVNVGEVETSWSDAGPVPGDPDWAGGITLEPEREGAACRLVQTAYFQPRGLLGILYWYAVMPLHGWVFSGMLAGLRREAERRARDVG